MTDAATPAASPVPRDLDRVQLPAGLGMSSIVEYLNSLPDDVDSMTFRDVTSTSNSATVVYLANEDSPTPEFGMVVAILLEPNDDAEAVVLEVATIRWGREELHQVTERSSDSPQASGNVAYRAFARSFPPGQFVIPNRSVHFLIWYRGGDEVAFMVIAHSAPARESLVAAVVETLGDGK